MKSKGTLVDNRTVTIKKSASANEFAVEINAKFERQLIDCNFVVTKFGRLVGGRVVGAERRQIYEILRNFDETSSKIRRQFLEKS